MKKIGILSAMSQEQHRISEAILVTQRTTIANREYISGSLAGKEVVASLSRWGKVASAQTATTLINTFGVDCIIFTGVAGGADPNLSVGDIVIGDTFIQHDFDASAVPPFRKFEIPLIGVSHFKADSALVQVALQAAKEYVNTDEHKDVSAEHIAKYSDHFPRVVTGLIASGDQFISSPTKLAELRNELPGLKCVEMEGAAVAQVCYEHNIPFVVIRALSDNANESAAIDFPAFLEHIAQHYSYGIVTRMLATLK